jgi:hypothetical protein
MMEFIIVSFLSIKSIIFFFKTKILIINELAKKIGY